jgi:hypothetical protein
MGGGLMTAAAFGHIAMEPKRVTKQSWWVDQPRQHFTVVCAQQCNTFIPAESDIGPELVAAYLKRKAMLEAVN